MVEMKIYRKSSNEGKFGITGNDSNQSGCNASNITNYTISFNKYEK
jgi:hypothetical protein